jgi:hypothetical protein
MFRFLPLLIISPPPKQIGQEPYENYDSQKNNKPDEYLFQESND